MSILYAFLIGLAVNLDNLLIGMNLSLRGQKLTLLQNLIIGATTGICAFAATFAARMISGNFLVYTNIIGALIMIVFGLYCLRQSLSGESEPTLQDNPNLKDILILSAVLAVNCLPPSFSAGAMNLSPGWIGGFAMLFSCLSMWISGRLGHRLHNTRLYTLLGPLSAILLILIGACELLF